jgi:hypothetical protein
MKQKMSSILMLLLAGTLFCQVPEEHHFSDGIIGIQMGIWKPSNLDDYPTRPFKNIAEADYAPGVFAVTPLWNGIGLRLQAFHWQYKPSDQTLEEESIKIRHVSLDVKHQIVSQTKLSPYATFGMSTVWAHALLDNAKQEGKYDRIGYGINVGAGVDLKVLKHIGIAIEYQYLYANFNIKIGGTENYSGPHLALKFEYLF